VTSIRTWLRVVVVGAVVIGVVAGCGRDSPGRPEDARGTAVGFVEAVQAQRFQRACESMSLEFSSDLRVNVLGWFRPTGTTTAGRHRQVQAARRRARTCQGLLMLLRSELSAGLATIAGDVARSRAAWLGPDHRAVALDDQAWVLSRHDDTWKIDTANALSEAPAPAAG
jgi:hypothetical protein